VRKEHVETGIPVFRDLEDLGTGKSGTETVVFCIDCDRRLLQQEGERRGSSRGIGEKSAVRGRAECLRMQQS
jgi:hypothetical protein